MPGGGKASCNAFFMFMQYYRAREEQRGVRFRGGFEAVVQPAGEEWRRMTSAEKEVYKKQAKGYKGSVEYRERSRCANRPKSNKQSGSKAQPSKVSSDEEDPFEGEDDYIYLDNDDNQRTSARRTAQRNNLKTTLCWHIGPDFENKIVQEKFIVVAVQNFYESSDFRCSPAELAFLEYSLSKGIMKQRHYILKPTFISDAMQNKVASMASSTHRILPNNLPIGARQDYRQVVNELKKLWAEKRYNRTFVLSKQFNSVQGACKALREATGSRTFMPPDNLNCLEDLHELMCTLKSASFTEEDQIKFNALSDECGWDFDSNTLCSFHNACSSKFCALALARKACYLMSMLLKDLYDVELTPDHVPLSVQSVDFVTPKLQNLLEPPEQMSDNAEAENQKNAAIYLRTMNYADEIAAARKDITQGRTTNLPFKESRAMQYYPSKANQLNSQFDGRHVEYNKNYDQNWSPLGESASVLMLPTASCGVYSKSTNFAGALPDDVSRLSLSADAADTAPSFATMTAAAAPSFKAPLPPAMRLPRGRGARLLNRCGDDVINSAAQTTMPGSPPRKAPLVFDEQSSGIVLNAKNAGYGVKCGLDEVQWQTNASPVAPVYVPSVNIAVSPSNNVTSSSVRENVESNMNNWNDFKSTLDYASCQRLRNDSETSFDDNINSANFNAFNPSLPRDFNPFVAQTSIDFAVDPSRFLETPESDNNEPGSNAVGFEKVDQREDYISSLNSSPMSTSKLRKPMTKSSLFDRS